MNVKPGDEVITKAFNFIATIEAILDVGAKPVVVNIDKTLNMDIEDLDISWINDFEKIDNEYNIYYTEEISFIKIHCVYINNNNEIEKITEEKIFLKTSHMSEGNIFSLVFIFK